MGVHPWPQRRHCHEHFASVQPPLAGAAAAAAHDIAADVASVVDVFVAAVAVSMTILVAPMHVLQERQRNITPLGLKFCSNRTIDYYWGNCRRLASPTVAEVEG